MKITAEITGIEYKIRLLPELKTISITDFDVNKIPSSCILANKKKLFAVSKWISPKRTRSYPYEKVYNTLSFPKKITIIPIIKDEGSEGDRDFIQWDTISLMSLLDVYVIFAYYKNAAKHGTRENKITNQQFDNKFVVDKIKDISNYHSSALHWNLKEVNNNFSHLIELAQQSYSRIENTLKIQLHNSYGIDTFKNQFKDDVKYFMDASRKKSEEAQNRESKTTQPKELLKTLTKATLTIKNYLGGLYFLTTDEILMQGKTLYLIESKHSRKSLIPSKGDIKDGLLKMILYSNLKKVMVDGIEYQTTPILNLTSEKLKGEIKSTVSEKEIEKFFSINKFSTSQKFFVNKLFSEAKINNFQIIMQNG